MTRKVPRLFTVSLTRFWIPRLITVSRNVATWTIHKSATFEHCCRDNIHWPLKITHSLMAFSSFISWFSAWFLSTSPRLNDGKKLQRDTTKFRSDHLCSSL